MKTKFIFDQPIHPYRYEILVCAGAAPKDVLRWVKKNGNKQAKKDYPEILKQHDDLFKKIIDGEKTGYALHFLKAKREYYFLLLKPFEDTWAYWECLIHELSHTVDWLVETCMMEKETEARAYLHEWLFNQIRRKLQGIDKI